MSIENFEKTLKTPFCLSWAKTCGQVVIKGCPPRPIYISCGIRGGLHPIIMAGRDVARQAGRTDLLSREVWALDTLSHFRWYKISVTSRPALNSWRSTCYRLLPNLVRTTTRREMVNRRIATLDPFLEDMRASLFAPLVGILEGDEPLAQIDALISRHVHSGSALPLVVQVGIYRAKTN